MLGMFAFGLRWTVRFHVVCLFLLAVSGGIWDLNLLFTSFNVQRYVFGGHFFSLYCDMSCLFICFQCLHMESERGGFSSGH